MRISNTGRMLWSFTLSAALAAGCAGGQPGQQPAVNPDEQSRALADIGPEARIPSAETPEAAGSRSPEKPEAADRRAEAPAPDSPVAKPPDGQARPGEPAPIAPQTPKPEAKPAPKPASSAGKYKTVYYSAKTTRKLAALTFDDGPDDRFTPQVLDVLKKHRVKATFFLMGRRVHKHPEIVRRIVREGHAIGNHTWSHPNLNKLKLPAVRRELERTGKELEAIAGVRTALFRPPYGNATEDVVDLAHRLGMRTIRWSVDTRDWEGYDSQHILKLVGQQLKPGGIILQHSAGGEGQEMGNTVEALEQLIPRWKREGYRFVTVPELLGIPGQLP